MTLAWSYFIQEWGKEKTMERSFIRPQVDIIHLIYLKQKYN